MLAMTPSSANRGMFERRRGLDVLDAMPPAGRPAGEGVERLADRRVTDRVHLQPASRVRLPLGPQRQSSSGAHSGSPRLEKPSYGSSRAAVCDSTTPSANAFRDAG